VAKLRTAILVNWPAKLTALLLSGVLWAAVAAEEPTTQLVPVKLAVDLPPGRSLAGALPPVQAEYAGSTRELIKLYSSPPIIRKVLPDTLKGSEYALELSPSDLIIGRRINVRAEDVQPRSVTIHLDAVVQGSVPVEPHVAILPDSGYVVQGIGLSPPTVTVTGPDSAVRRLRSVPTVSLELRSVSTPVQRTVAIDTAGLGAVRVSPESVQVSADVTFVAERVLTGVPVKIEAERPGDFVAEPSIVLVTVRGSGRRLPGLTRDSVVVVASPSTTEATERVQLEVRAPDGVTGVATPDSVTLTRRPRG
jgi:hypothetical protein